MTLDLAWGNLANYCLQIGLLIGVAAFIPSALQLAMPRTRLAFWHILLATSILLPLLEPWRHQAITVAAPVITAPPVAHSSPWIAASRPLPWDRIALGILAAGMMIRLAWLAIGLLRLRQYRRRSLPLEPAGSWSVEADLRLSADVASPVTFGILRPVVLLPVNFPELEPATQDAILCHEIIHVRRKDWAVTLTEEMVRSIFWFHPAIWWLLGEIGLSREQAVDREVIDMTRSREEYVDALLAIAGAKPRLDLAPAPLFLRKRHLKQRVVSIMKEARMSKRRSVSALAASLGVLAAACWLVTMAFPLAAEPQMVADGPGVTVDLGSAAIMHRTSVIYPPAARIAKVEGTVLVEATTDGSGNVVDARILSGPNELRRSVLQSVLQWHFANDTGGNTRQVRVTFTKPPESETPKQVTIRTANGETRTVTVPAGAPIEGVMGGVIGGVPGGVAGGVSGGMVASVLTPNWVGKPLKDVMVFGLTDDAKNRLTQRLPVRAGDVLAADSLERTTQAVHEYDEHMNVGTTRDRDGNVSFIISAPGASVPSSAFGVAEALPAPPPANGAKRITIGGNVQSAKLVSQEKPVYPPLAKQARISGTVKLQAIIAVDGSIRNLQVVSGHPLLVPAALDAVRTWVYQKTLLNGEPVEVMTQIDVNFTLSDGPPPQQ